MRTSELPQERTSAPFALSWSKCEWWKSASPFDAACGVAQDMLRRAQDERISMPLRLQQVKRAFILSCAALLLLVKPALAIDIEVVESKSGITAWLVEEHSLPLVSVAAAFRGGAAMDPEGKAGLANMASGLLDEGAAEMDATAFQSALQDKAIRLGFSAGKDTFSLSLRTLSEFSTEAFRLLGLALTRPRFDADAVERIRRQIIVGIKHDLENPESIARRRWREAYFGAHPYGRDTEGTLESVPMIEIADLKRFVKERLARDNLVIAVVGDITPEALRAYLDTAFGKLPAKSIPYVVPPVEAPAGDDLVVVEEDVPQAVVRFGHNGIKRNDPDWYAAYVMNYILGGGGFASRLTTTVREENGLAYHVSTHLVPMDFHGVFLGNVATENAQVGRSIGLIRAEIARLASEGVTAEELDAAKNYLTGSYPLNFDTSREIAGQLIGIQLEKLGLDYVDKRNSLIEAVTLADVNRVAKALLHPDRLIWTVVGQPPADLGSAPAQGEAGDDGGTASSPASEPEEAGQ